MTQPQPNDDDASLVRRCLQGDGSAWAALVARYERLIFAIARRGGLVEADGADVLQTVFLRLLKHMPTLNEPDKLQAWIVTTSKREVLTRRRRHEPTVPLDDPSADGNGRESEALQVADDAAGPEASLEHWQRVMRVRRALESLDTHCRRLLMVLFGSDSPGYSEASNLLDMPLGSIGPTRARCLEKLRRVLVDDS